MPGGHIRALLDAQLAERVHRDQARRVARLLRGERPAGGRRVLRLRADGHDRRPRRVPAHDGRREARPVRLRGHLQGDAHHAQPRRDGHGAHHAQALARRDTVRRRGHSRRLVGRPAAGHARGAGRVRERPRRQAHPRRHTQERREVHGQRVRALRLGQRRRPLRGKRGRGRRREDGRADDPRGEERGRRGARLGAVPHQARRQVALPDGAPHPPPQGERRRVRLRRGDGAGRDAGHCADGGTWRG